MATGTRVYANLEQGTISGAHTDSTTTLTFTTGKEPGFSLATGEYAVLAIGDDFADMATVELIHGVGPYTAGASTMTIERGQEGTTAQAHSDAAEWRLVMVASDLTNVVQGDNLLFEHTVTSAQATITFDNIPAGYGDLQVTVRGRSTHTAADGLDFRFNDDAGTNYAWQRIRAFATTADGTENLSDTALQLMALGPTGMATGDMTGGVVHLIDYAGDGFKVGIGNGFYSNDTNGTLATGELNTVQMTGMWRSTAAITKLTLLLVNGNFDVGTTVRVYGMRKRDAAQTSFIGAKVNRTTNFSVATATFTDVSLDTTAEFDSHSFWDSGNNQFVIPEGQAGKYQVTLVSNWNHADISDPISGIRLNGVTVAQTRDNGAMVTAGQVTTVTLDLAVGDTIKGRVYHASGTSKNWGPAWGAEYNDASMTIVKLGQSLVGTLNELSDTNVASPAANSTLKYDATTSKWVASQDAGFSGAHVSLSADHTGLVNSGKVNFDTVDWDTDSYWDGTNDEFVIPETGYYLVTGHVQFINQDTTDDAYIAFSPGTTGWTYSQGANTTYRFGRDQQGAGQPGREGTAVFRFAAGDTVNLTAVGDASFDVRTDGAFFSIHRIKGEGNAVAFTGARVKLATNTTTMSPLPFDTVEFDSHSFWNGTDRFVIPAGQAGKYLVSTSIWTSVAASTESAARIFVNGVGMTDVQMASSASSSGRQSHAILDLAAGDEVYISVSGTSITIYGESQTGDGFYRSHFALTKLGQASVNGMEASNGGKEVIDTTAASGATHTIDLAAGNVHDLTLDNNCTLTFSGATSGVSCSFTLLLKQDGTGGRTVTWPGSVKWHEGVTPTLTTTASAESILTFTTLDGGTTWYGSLVGDAFA